MSIVSMLVIGSVIVYTLVRAERLDAGRAPWPSP